MKINLEIDDGKIHLLTKKLKTGASKITDRAVFLTMNKMETLAKQNIRKSIYRTTPPGKPFKRTRKAVQSITGDQSSSTSARVFMGVDYGKYLEKGTGIYAGHRPYFTTFGGILPHPIKYKGMKARPFWVPAIEETREAIPSLLKKAVKESL
jgi:hypothetical protein